MQRLLDDYSGLPLWLQSLIALCALAVAALTVNWLLKKVLLRIAAPYLDARSDTVDRSAAWLTTVIPLLLVSRGIGLVPHLPEEVVNVTVNIARTMIVLSIAMAIGGALDYAAVLMLVFKDTILSLVASVQLSSNDMLRVGDWIEMPGMNADGDVVDIALHTVKIRNFDKTITTIPTHRLIADSFRNWRGMNESGGSSARWSSTRIRSASWTTRKPTISSASGCWTITWRASRRRLPNGTGMNCPAIATRSMRAGSPISARCAPM